MRVACSSSGGATSASGTLRYGDHQALTWRKKGSMQGRWRSSCYHRRKVEGSRVAPTCLLSYSISTKGSPFTLQQVQVGARGRSEAVEQKCRLPLQTKLRLDQLRASWQRLAAPDVGVGPRRTGDQTTAAAVLPVQCCPLIQMCRDAQVRQARAKGGAHRTRATTWQSGLVACAGRLVTRARNSRADRACPVYGLNCTRMRDICFSCIAAAAPPPGPSRRCRCWWVGC